MDAAAEAQLVAKLRARDEGALLVVIETFGPVVFGMARRVLAEPSLAEEVAQDTFVALWQRPGAFDAERGRLQAFLLGVARNKAIDLVRREQSLRRTKDALLGETRPPSENPLGDESIDEIDDRLRVRTAVAELSPVQREAIVLAYFGGRTYREVAQELGIPEGTAKTRLRDGLTRLRELMSSARGGE